VVRELVETRTLAQVIESEGPFPPQRMLTIARQIANALDYAHQNSITHGDLSANQVYVGSNDHVVVTDFGQTQAMAGTSLAKQGFAVGSPETTAPERVQGQGPSRQSDLYSLGILCYQMLAKEPPFTGSATAVLHAQAYEQPRPLHLINPQISVPLSETIGRMLSKGLELRYNTGSEYSRALSVANEGTAPIRARATAAAQVREAGLDDRTPLWQRSWVWGLVAIPIIGFFLLVGFGAISLWNALQPASVALPTPTFIAPTSIVSATSEADTPPTQPTNTPFVVATDTALPQTPTDPTPTQTASPAPTFTPTLIPLPTPGPPLVAEDSPFTNLVLAHGITTDNFPDRVGTAFSPGTEPIYLFFDYSNIDPNTPWTHRWTWGDTELGVYQDNWSDSYSSSGTAWVFYTPTGGYQPGPYKVTLEVEGRVVGTATFVVEPGGI
ncbi:MAG: serine/threonine-protein kinase, partial [Chloroflexota bacterium]